MKWITLFVLCAPLAATVVTGTIRLPDGTLANGRASITLSGTCVGVGGAVVVPSAKTVDIVDGALSVDLEPSSTCVPARAYKVQYSLKAGVSPVEFWQVPASGPTTIGAIRVAGTPTVLASLGLSLLTGGLSKGDIIVHNGNGFTRVPRGAPGTVPRSDDSAPTGISWQLAASGGGASYGRYSGSLSSASTWSIPGSTHGLGTCALAIGLWVGGLAVEAGTTTCNPSTFDVTIPFTSAVAGDVFLSSDPVLVADSPWAGSLVSQVVAQSVNSSTITINHNLNGVVLLRCYTGTNQRLGFNVGTVVTANSLTVSFIGSVASSSYCIAAR